MEDYALERTTGPTVEPLSLAEAKLHLRVDDDLTADNLLIADLIVAAREYCEEVLGQALVSQTWTLYLDCFPSWEIRIPRPPLRSITSIKYLDVNSGTLTTLSPSLYSVDTASKPGRVTPIVYGYWPVAQWSTNSVQIVFVAGAASAAGVPARVRQAMKLLIGHWYVNREEVVVGATSTQVQQASEALLMTAWAGDY